MTESAAYERPEIDITPPNGETKVLIHSCCAPCSGELMELMVENGVDLTIFFYNPNIHPKKEYEIRKQENIRFAEKMNIPFVDGDYDVQNWFHKAKGMGNEPERGVRCTMCFDMRFVRTAQYAEAHGFKVITSSLGISRWKNMEQINASGHFAASQVEDVMYWDYNWRAKGGGARMYEIAKRERFYKQEYCGCIYSLRDTNQWRTSNDRETIAIGEEFYEKKLEESVKS
jgi:predicted adenine nucleotide alpha hydrolase (AANH) superfamily ATPase